MILRCDGYFPEHMSTAYAVDSMRPATGREASMAASEPKCSVIFARANWGWACSLEDTSFSSASIRAVSVSASICR